MKSKTVTRIVFASLSTMMAVGLAGSIAGSLAWYQYSIKANIAYTSTAAHSTHNLKIKVGDGNWSTNLSALTIQDYLLHKINRSDTCLRPVTTGDQDKDAALNPLKCNPIKRYTETSSWRDANTETDYIVLPISFKLVENDGDSVENLSSKRIYISDLRLLESPIPGKNSIVEALRVHFAAPDKNLLFSSHGNDVETFGKLSLTDDDDFDYVEDFEGNKTYLIYGGDGTIAESYAMNDTSVIADDSVPYEIVSRNPGEEIGYTIASVKTVGDLPVSGTDGQKLYVTELNANYIYSGLTGWKLDADHTVNALAAGGVVDETYYNQVEKKTYKCTGPNVGDYELVEPMTTVYVTIYLEGWQKIKNDPAGEPDAVWDDDKFVGSRFNIDISFTTETHDVH